MVEYNGELYTIDKYLQMMAMKEEEEANERAIDSLLAQGLATGRDPMEVLLGAASRAAQEELLEGAPDTMVDADSRFARIVEIPAEDDAPASVSEAYATLILDHPEYEHLTATHGADPACAYLLIRSLSSDLAGHSSLIKKLVEELFTMLPASEQPDLLRSLFADMPDEQQQSIQVNGL